MFDGDLGVWYRRWIEGEAEQVTGSVVNVDPTLTTLLGGDNPMLTISLMDDDGCETHNHKHHRSKVTVIAREEDARSNLEGNWFRVKMSDGNKFKALLKKIDRVNKVRTYHFVDKDGEEISVKKSQITDMEMRSAPRS